MKIAAVNEKFCVANKPASRPTVASWCAQSCCWTIYAVAVLWLFICFRWFARVFSARFLLGSPLEALNKARCRPWLNLLNRESFNCSVVTPETTMLRPACRAVSLLPCWVFGLCGRSKIYSTVLSNKSVNVDNSRLLPSRTWAFLPLR